MLLVVSREEYVEYIRNITAKDESKVKTLSNRYLVCSMGVLVVGVLFVLRDIYLFLRFPISISLFRFCVCILCIVLGVIMLCIRRSNKKYFKNNYRKKIIDYLLNDYDYHFREEGWPMSWDFDHSQFVKSYDFCSTSDCLIINIPNDDGSKSKVDLKICDLYAYDIHRDEEGNVSHSKVYKGMFATVEFPRKFKCFLSVDVNYKKKGLKLEKVELEDINFNKKFKVKSDNQIEARYILTPKMMEKLLLLEEKFNNLKLVFVDNYLYIGAPNVDLFELDNFKNNDHVTVFEDLYDEVNTSLQIVEEIKNNNKVFKTERRKRVSDGKVDK